MAIEPLSMLKPTDVLEAAKRIAPYAHKTPIHTCSTLNRVFGCELYFKCENFQKIGAFKFRGACNTVFQLSDSDASKGVVTHSSGNHAQALALAAKMRGIPAYIVMPSNSNPIKRAGVIEYGGKVIDCEPNQAARESTAARIMKETGATMVHPYDDPRVIAGQGTSALELIQEIPDLDIVIAPVGGGGLISGTCLASKLTSHPIKVLAAEPAGANDAFRSKQANRWIPLENPNTICDGLRTSLGEWTWPFVQNVVHSVLIADDKEIARTARLLWERAKLLIEPSSAVALAIVGTEQGRELCRNRRVGVILSGGNVDLTSLAWLTGE